ncbi:type I glyceraldehyde-3-phosphate dehydrogenase [Francisellaceae bacterium]|nr:type I glyceraldehyde-3-phosphate dehydrogenase [Francisellaceae bacterium]
MAIRIAINGYGRIGRNVLRAIYETNQQSELQVVAINDMADLEMNAHLTKFDTTHGKFPGDVSVEGGKLVVNGDKIDVFSEKDPAQLPWGKLNVDVVYECTGIFQSKTKAQPHLQAGAKKVLVSAPCGTDTDATIVYGVNHNVLTSSMQVVSNASCTTNCLSPVVQPLNNEIGIESGLMTTIHSFTNDQRLLDVAHSDIRRARSATQSMIPTKTGAAAAVGLVLPELKGKLDGFAMRVPTINVSVVDLTFKANKDTTVDEVNAILKKASENELKGVLAYNTLPLVSVDFNHDPHPSVFDATQTRVIGNLVKVLAWYDNEWGFSNQMLRTTKAWMAAK